MRASSLESGPFWLRLCHGARGGMVKNGGCQSRDVCVVVEVEWVVFQFDVSLEDRTNLKAASKGPRKQVVQILKSLTRSCASGLLLVTRWAVM